MKKALKALFIAMVIVAVTASLVDAGSNGKGKGAGNGKGKGRSEEQVKEEKVKKNQGKALGHNKENKAQSISGSAQAGGNSQATGTASNVERRRNNAERKKEQVNTRANRPEIANRGRNSEAWIEKKQQTKVDDMLASLNRARWFYNPHDERGQGNRGKPDMKDPYGFDKDSGREKSERGRPGEEELIVEEPQAENPTEEPAVEEEPEEEQTTEDIIVEEGITEETPNEEIIVEEVVENLLNLDSAITVDFEIDSGYMRMLENALASYTRMLEEDPTNSYYAYAISSLQCKIYGFNYVMYNNADVGLLVTPYSSFMDETITYNIAITPPEELVGKTCLVTSSLEKFVDADADTSSPGTYTTTQVSDNYYNEPAPENIVKQETQEVVFEDVTNLSFVYTSAFEDTGLSNLSITVTEPETGDSYVMYYERPLSVTYIW